MTTETECSVTKNPFQDIICPLGFKEATDVMIEFNKFLSAYNEEQSPEGPVEIEMTVSSLSVGGQPSRTGFRIENKLKKKVAFVTCGEALKVDKFNQSSTFKVSVYAAYGYSKLVPRSKIALMDRVPFARGNLARAIAYRLVNYLELKERTSGGTQFN